MCVHTHIYIYICIWWWSKIAYAPVPKVNLTRTLRAAYALTRTLRAACATLRQPWFSNDFSKAYARLAPSLRELTPAGFFRVCLTFWFSSRQSSEKLTRSLRELTHALFLIKIATKQQKISNKTEIRQQQNSNKTATNQQQNRNKTATKQQQNSNKTATKQQQNSNSHNGQC